MRMETHPNECAKTGYLPVSLNGSISAEMPHVFFSFQSWLTTVGETWRNE